MIYIEYYHDKIVWRFCGESLMWGEGLLFLVARVDKHKKVILSFGIETYTYSCIKFENFPWCLLWYVSMEEVWMPDEYFMVYIIMVVIQL